MGTPWSRQEDAHLLEQMPYTPGTVPIPLGPPNSTSWHVIARQLTEKCSQDGKKAKREYTAWSVCKRWCDVLMPALEELVREKGGWMGREGGGGNQGGVGAAEGEGRGIANLLLRYEPVEGEGKGLLTVEEMAKFGLVVESGDGKGDGKEEMKAGGMAGEK